MMIFYGFLVAIAVLALVFMTVFYPHIRRAGRPTSGEVIDKEERSGEALIVIDVQEDFTRRSGKGAFEETRRRAAIGQMNALIEEHRKRGNRIVFIRNVFYAWPVRLVMRLGMGGAGNAGRPGLAFDRDLDAVGGEVFEKSIGDSFFNPELEGFLASHAIGRLTLVGLDACHCVQLTARGALQRGYEINIVEEGLLTAFPEKWPDCRQDLVSRGAVLEDGLPVHS